MSKMCISFQLKKLKQLQICLPQNTSVHTLNSLCPYFQIFERFFVCGCTTNQSKRSSVKGQFFYYSSCKNSVWTHIFNYTDAPHSEPDDFILFTSAKVILDQRLQNTFQKQYTMCAAFADADATFLKVSWASVVWSEFVSLVLWILPPLRWFRAATYHRQHQTRHIGRWPTSVKFRCKVDVHWFNKLFWPIRTSPILQAGKWLEIYKCQRTITPHQRSTIRFAGNNSHHSRRDFCTFWKLCVSILRNTGVLPYCRPISVPIQANTDG